MITLQLTAEEILLIRNCIDRVIRDNEYELTHHSCDGTRQLLAVLYLLDKKFTELWESHKKEQS